MQTRSRTNEGEVGVSNGDNRPRREPRVNQDRNRRMFAGIQSVLGGTPVPGSSREKREPRRSEPVEKLADLDSIISQISDMSIRPDRSAAQIKRNISASPHLPNMSSSDWDRLCVSLLSSALGNSEADFVVGLFVPLMEYELFCDAMCSLLMTTCSAFIIDNKITLSSNCGDSPPNDSSTSSSLPIEDNSSIPTLLGAIMCAPWPRNMSKAIDTVNPVLFTAVSIVKGWLLVLNEDNEAIDTVDSFDEEDEDEETPSREDPYVVNRCAQAVTSLCESTQRSLWMKWPEICDEIYASIKPAITHNNGIRGSVKCGLLHTLISLHSWTKAKSVTTRSAQTQTV